MSFRELDYGRLGEWLDRIVALDERSEYPHFSAAKIYTNVADDGRRRTIIEWVRRHFRDEPDVRWEWMAHAANFAQHVMKDQSLAISMARELREKTTPGAVPGWTRQMEVFLLENKNEYEAAASLLFNLLQAGEVTEPIEFSFLLGRLEGMAKTMIERGEVRTPEEIDKIEARLDQLKACSSPSLILPTKIRWRNKPKTLCEAGGGQNLAAAQNRRAMTPRTGV